MENLEIQKIGTKVVLFEKATQKKQVFADYHELVNHVNRFKLADMITNINHLPFFWFKRLDPLPVAYQNHEPHIDHVVQLTKPIEGGLS